MPTITETIDLMKRCHAGQIDESGNPYWMHPYRVLKRVSAVVSDDAKHAALLHDVLEDTDVTKNYLISIGYSPYTIDLVSQITKPTTRPFIYNTWIDDIIDSGNMDLIILKYGDMLDNTSPSRLNMLPKRKREYFINKYEYGIVRFRKVIKPEHLSLILEGDLGIGDYT